MARILIVEDEPGIADAVAKSLESLGHQAVCAVDGVAGLEAFEADRFDLVLLDVMLPRMDGFEVCRRLRGASKVPILMLTARDSEIDRVVGLEIGADDYVVKPFSLRELGARVKALLRRREMDAVAVEATAVDTPQGIPVLDAWIDVDARVVRVDEREVELSRREFDLLQTLVSHPRRVLTREWLMNRVWGRDFDGTDRTIDVHVMRLREKLGRDSQVARAITSLRGVGYRFGV